uniref:Oryzain alpha chain n=1 Tax=Aegilops tauschii TaxID=37682 RepID=M8B4D7_AEGTA
MRSSMSLLVAALLLLLSVAAAADMSRSEEEMRRMHAEWMAEHGRVYNATGEGKRRFEVFRDNLRDIDQHNAAADAGVHSFRLGLNPFSDLTYEEFQSRYLGAQTKPQRERKLSVSLQAEVNVELAESVDWRKKGAVGPVKNQGSCSSAWAFAATATIEGINQIVTGDMIPLSAQELLDCTSRYGNDGCDGGLALHAFEFIIHNRGIASEEDYPYQASQNRCDPEKQKSRVVTIDGYENVPSNSEKSLQKAVANQPIVAMIMVSDSFASYAGGIFNGDCEFKGSVNHEVVVIGYGTGDGNDYWIVRNSWGASWGENGYIRMKRNIEASSGMCGIAFHPYYPRKAAKILP